MNPATSEQIANQQIGSSP